MSEVLKTVVVVVVSNVCQPHGDYDTKPFALAGAINTGSRFSRGTYYQIRL